MSEEIKIENIIRNTRKYWYVDGLSEIAVGLIIFFAGLTYWFVAQMENTAYKLVLLTLAQPVVMIVGSWLARKILPRIKDRVTYPRTGYLVFRKPVKKRRFHRILYVGLIAAVVGALVTIISSALSERFLPFLSSIFLAMVSIYIGYHTAVQRFYWIGLVMLGCGAFLSYLNFSGPLPYTLLFSGTGLIWIISGIITLILYLRKTQPLVEEL
ncbi:MAG: hypothetical protein CVU40_06425 [Chloroflexi bacterium HGW-Chloroflexi-2]|jgi:hypothetical protein|nr:MAG: hypothetical protein CVU40_06425 [Chloroflexi bacterium HGW-Chloroflexi-2]